jgi:hypothetical protein
MKPSATYSEKWVLQNFKLKPQYLQKSCFEHQNKLSKFTIDIKPMIWHYYAAQEARSHCIAQAGLELEILLP